MNSELDTQTLPIEIVETTLEHKSLISSLLQLYVYEFSGMIPLEVDAEGRYDESDLEGCWEESWIHTFLLRVNDHPAGFAIVRLPHQSTTRDVWIEYNEIAEFFVMRRYQRLGVGKAFARALFDRFSGTWRVAQIQENTRALAFWRSIIGEYTNGQFEDTIWQSNTRTGTVQYFTAHGLKRTKASEGDTIDE